MGKTRQFSYGLGGLGVLLGGVGVFLISERARNVLNHVSAHLDAAPERLEGLADTTQMELDRIRQTLNQIAARLHAVS